MTAGHRWHSCGDELLRFLVAGYQEGGQTHWPTLISATAALSGEMALLANEREFPESGYVSSRKTGQFIHNGVRSPKTLWGYCEMVAREAFGLTEDDLPDYNVTEPRAHVGAALGYPDLSVPAHLAPRDNPFNAGPRHRKSVLAIAGHHGLDYADCAFSLSTAAMKMIGFTRTLGLPTMTCLALETMVAASRYAPRAEVAHDPAFGSITDVLARGGADQPVRPPLAEDQTRDIWGEAAHTPPSANGESAEESGRRAAGGFGRRR